ncbi:hypothetical protein KFL_000050370 [Klebsormidium nitens]|uniref:Uncharacterized protein n=1 Tax=Klebsormidium nitens TaxID=105231 RepID=A0A1Y1HHF9_KLENI|nr:hypothetical protein KFL_000050370 [Klebsormidium nitens]|eukprot:GAQ77900.1 hypothetical protein KFL_000050370 [Klebsormidium nitens]
MKFMRVELRDDKVMAMSATGRSQGGLVFSPPFSPPSLPPGGGDYILLRRGRSLPHMRGGERSPPPDHCGEAFLEWGRIMGGEFSSTGGEGVESDGSPPPGEKWGRQVGRHDQSSLPVKQRAREFFMGTADGFEESRTSHGVPANVLNLCRYEGNNGSKHNI